MTRRTFISYSRKDEDEVATLYRALTLRGVRPWQDLHDLEVGTRFQGDIRSTLVEECDSIVIYVTPNSLASEHVMKMEVLTAIRHARQVESFRIIPIFRGIDPSEAGRQSRDSISENIALFNGPALPDQDNLTDTNIANAARSILRTILKLREPAPDTAPIIDVQTRSRRTMSPPAHLDIDWTEFFTEDDIPTFGECEAVFLPALRDIGTYVMRIWGTGQPLHLRPKVNIPIGIALGYIFRSTTGAELDVEQDGDVWSTTLTPSSDDVLSEKTTDDVIGSGDIAAELSVTLPIWDSVSRYIAETGAEFQTRLALDSTQGYGDGAVRTGAQALSMARQTANAIRSIRQQRRADRTHLFAAVPVALSVLLGYHLNARGPIRLYEYNQYDSSQPPYLPVFDIG